LISVKGRNARHGEKLFRVGRYKRERQNNGQSTGFILNESISALDFAARGSVRRRDRNSSRRKRKLRKSKSIA